MIRDLRRRIEELEGERDDGDPVETVRDLRRSWAATTIDLGDAIDALTTARADLAKARVREWVLLAAATSLESDAHEMMATAEGEDIGGMMAAYGRISGVRDELAAIASPAPPEPDTDGRTDGGCDLFERGPRSPIADCISDGHYQCVECVELSEEGADIRRANEDDAHLAHSQAAPAGRGRG